MKVYLDENLMLSSVETEELTQDSVGYNILKLYVPNSVVNACNSFTAYYGAILPNSRKVGYFGMTSYVLDVSDADYAANYTYFKATLEQVITSVPGKVYLGFQFLMGISGNATLTKKNSAVVMFNVRKSVAINNDILVIDPDDNSTDVLESYKNLLQTALNTYVTQANQALSVTTQSLSVSGDITCTNIEVTSGKITTNGKTYTLPNATSTLAKESDITSLQTSITSLSNNKADLSNTTQEITAKAFHTYGGKVEVYEGSERTYYGSDDIKKAGQHTYTYTFPSINGTFAMTSDVSTEATTRSNADTNLQNQINTLKSVQNVIDTVATYADLMALSTTNILSNDKVQVIADENYDNATTIYNWNGSSWVYVGAYGGNAYTKTETNTLLANKMDKNNAKATGTFKLNVGTVSGSNAVAMNGGYARGDYSFSFGDVTEARGDYSFAFGYGAEAKNNYSYAFGYSAIARNDYSMALGFYTMVTGNYSMALGYGTKANGDSQLVFGENNLSDSTSLEIVGNGDYSNSTYSNARLLDSNGDEYLAGDLYINTTFTGSGGGSLSSKSGTSVRSALASANNTISTLQTSLSTAQKQIAVLEQETANLKQASLGNTMKEATYNGLAYEYTLDSDTLPYGYLNKVGGMSYKTTNLIGLADVSETTTNDVTYSISSNEITLNGTASADTNLSFSFSSIPSGTYTLAMFVSGTTSSSAYPKITTSSFTIRPNSTTSTQTISSSISTLACYFANGTTFTSFKMKIMLVQGSTAPTEYSEYFSGIRHTAPTSVTNKSLNVQPIPSSVASTTTNDVTWYVTDGILYLNGTSSAGAWQSLADSSFSLEKGTYTIAWFTNFTDNTGIGFGLYNANTGDTYQINADRYKTITLTETTTFNIIVWWSTSGMAFSNIYLKSMVVKGSTAPSTYTPYSKITKSIPAEIQALDGYGWGLSQSVNNYADFDNGKFVQMIGEYSVDSAYAIGDTITISDIKSDTTNVLSSEWGDLSNWGTISGTTITLTQALTSGGTIYYLLATPEITDISSYLDTDFNVLSNLEDNGTLVFDNTYQQEAFYEIFTYEKL